MKRILATVMLLTSAVAPVAVHAARVPCGQTRVIEVYAKGSKKRPEYRYSMEFGPGVRDAWISFGGNFPSGVKLVITDTRMLHSPYPLRHTFGSTFAEGYLTDFNPKSMNIVYDNPPADKLRPYVYMYCTN